MAALRIEDVTLVPMDGPADAPLGHVRRGDLLLRDGRVAALGDLGAQRERRGGGDATAASAEQVLSGSGLVALPGFVQGHVHLCQTLLRGLADDLPLLPWLQQRIWPLEAAHDAASTRASADLALLELLRGGTTALQTMESVRHTEQAFFAALAAGVTAIAGNCLMDAATLPTPPALLTKAREAMRISEELRTAFDGRDGRLAYAVSPRFVLSCSDELTADAVAFAAAHRLRVHTHAAEHPDEVAAVRACRSRDYVLVLEQQGWLGPRTGLAHCVHTSVDERAALRRHDAAVLHCPSANLKLGSGIAPIADYARTGLRVALGADGAPCNNRLSALAELRQAALLQAFVAGPGAWPAEQALHALTRGGARALGLDGELGALVPGLRADVVLLDLGAPELEPGGTIAGSIVYAATDAHVRHVVLGGELVVRDGQHVRLDAGAVQATARRERQRLLQRAGLAR